MVPGGASLITAAKAKLPDGAMTKEPWSAAGTFEHEACVRLPFVGSMVNAEVQFDCTTYRRFPFGYTASVPGTVVGWKLVTGTAVVFNTPVELLTAKVYKLSENSPLITSPSA